MTARSNHDAAVLVLGASRGLGRGIAEALAQIGFTVGIGCRKLENAKDVSGAIRSAGGRAVPIVVDVTQNDMVEAAVGAIRGAAPRFAGLVNNAGVIHPIGHIADTDPALWAEALHANLLGPSLGARAALPHLDPGGVIVNVSSGAASTPMGGWGAYCCTKAGLAMLTRMIDHEYRDRGIYATASARAWWTRTCKGTLGPRA
jgi:NAD(P)-dependent dehydrogenase (short-subunit alcohol dehydrogenase family)